jgi:hypothetical protein
MTLPRRLPLFGRDPILDKLPRYLRRAFEARNECTAELDFATANSMQDIGRKLLQSIGFASPDDVSIAAAIEANDAFIARLEAIRDAAQGLTIDQDDSRITHRR